MGEVLKDAVQEVCKYTEEGEGLDMLRKSLQRVFARSLGERDYHLYEAVQLGLGLPQVLQLMDVVSLNTSGARRLKTSKQMKGAQENDAAVWDSRVDLFDQRRHLLAKMKAKGGAEKIQETELEHSSIGSFACTGAASGDRARPCV